MKLKKWGNSYGVRIPKNAMDFLNIDENSEFEIVVNKEKGMISLNFSPEKTNSNTLVINNRK